MKPSKSQISLRNGKINVLLINPADKSIFQDPQSQHLISAVKKTDFPPLGLLYIASYLRSEFNEMVQVQVIDGKLFPNEYLRNKKNLSLKNARCKFKHWILSLISNNYVPDIIGVSGPYHCMAEEFHYAVGLLKKQFKDSVIICGGPYPFGSYLECIRDEHIDYIILGEGEIRFADLLKYLLGKIDRSNLEGIVYRTEKEIISVPSKKTVDLSTLPFPARDLIRVQSYWGFSSERNNEYMYDNKIRASIYTTRGCPNLCTYCYSGEKNYFGPGIRFRTVDDIIAEISQCINNYNIDEFQILDENAACNGEFIIELFNIFYKKFPNKKLTLCCIDLRYINETVLKAICQNKSEIWFTFGLESGSDRVLNSILKRNITTGKMIEKVKIILNSLAQINLKYYYLQGSVMFGIPGETLDEMKETILFCQQLSLDWYGVFIYMPIPGTSLYEMCVKKGYIKGEKIDYSKLNRKVAILKTPNFNQQEVIDIANGANYYLNFVKNPNIKKNPDKAINAFKYVLTVVSNHPFALYGLAKSYETKNYVKESKLFMNRFWKEIKNEPYCRFKYLISGETYL